ncbi:MULTISPECIES: ArnT family glycosyltransferase [unclassified Rathayibacter]|uniref:ArnT family glycosyltransferase n=1 Tax=unclassified Rathayibacter TaxID=2609250 RepID=UPI0006F66179|nr:MULTISPECIES: hypothetical protein [unclassified Rathayibacter]KQQ05580.1 hypothetical protein ASF42_03150 [Rathayibacter sp. Leaf294]KQS13441.1 hypothetical protein ASG06_03160 [Rathayibacter sp. Leaf185]
METATALDPSPARDPRVPPLIALLRSPAAWAHARWSDLGAVPTGRRVPGSVTVFVVVLVIGALASVVSVSSGAGITYRDEQLHLSIARRLFDSATPGFQQLGTVWLPVPHLILAPFVIDFGWWVSGAGAAIVGTVCLAASASALYRIAARMRGGRTARLATVAAFVSSPAVLYVFTTPLTEPVLIAGLLGCIAGLARWVTARRRHSFGETAVFCGIPLAIAVMSRYEGWALLAGGVLFVLVVSFRRDRRVASAVSSAIGLALPSAVAIAWWLAYNAATYGNPLEFANGQFSAAELQRGITEAGLVTTAGNPGISVYVYGWSIVQAFGPATAVLATGGAVLLAVRDGLSDRFLLLGLTSVPALFSLVSLAAGQSVIYSDHTLPTGWWNTRYALVAGLFTSVLIGYLVQAVVEARGRARPTPRTFRAAVGVTVLIALGGQSLWMLQAPDRVAVLAEAADQRAAFADLRRSFTWLGGEYDGGGILVDESQNPFVLDLGLPLVELVDYAAGDAFVLAQEDPENSVEWIFLNEDNEVDTIARTLSRHPERLEGFALVHSDGPYRVYRRW